MAEVTGRYAVRELNGAERESLLCVANFPANTGYAWDFIEGLYAGVADRLAVAGMRTWVAYPALGEAPRSLSGSRAQPVELDARLGRLRCVLATLKFIRGHNIRVVYLADRPAWHPVYLVFRMFGIRRIVVHDHTSGERTIPVGLKRALKWMSRRLVPGMMADVVIGVSDFVVRRKIEVDLIPQARVHRVWNSLEVPPPDSEAAFRLRREFGLAPDATVIFCACRASREKGVDHLLRAFDQAVQEANGDRAVLLYLGDGPDLGRLNEIRVGLRQAHRIHFAGYRTDAAALLAGADICVVPSVWQEAFGLSALEPMARGIPVIASRVGGIPEVVSDGETGLLVPPGNENALAAALRHLLSEPAERRRLGENGRVRAAEFFSQSEEIDQLTALVQKGLPLGRT